MFVPVFAPDDIEDRPSYRGVRVAADSKNVFVWFAFRQKYTHESGKGRSYAFYNERDFSAASQQELHGWLDNNWDRATCLGRLMRWRLGPCDGIPWEIHDIEDPVAREAATRAFLESR